MNPEQLCRRHASNPVLTAADFPYPVHSVFNPAATVLPDGRTLLLCRVEDHKGFSHLGKAISEDGVSNWIVSNEPALECAPELFVEELYGIEDARIAYLEDEGRYAITYTAYGELGAGVSMALTSDFENFERLGLILQPHDKDAALFPRKINGEYAMIHRPIAPDGAHIWISFSKDLRSWARPTLVMRARRGGWWDAGRIGLAGPPIEVEEGWLMMYHGVRVTVSGALYRVGLALLDKDDPTRALLRSAEWIMGPREPYELVGDVPNVVFPCGTVLEEDGDTLRIYYGAADEVVCLAMASLREMLDWLKENGRAVSSDGF